MPGLPCGGNLTGNMLETITGKKLGKSYYVYKYTQGLPTSRLPSNVWTPDAESHVAQYLKNKHQGKGDYLLAHVPRVCARVALFDQCSKRPPTKVETGEEVLCHFVNTHQTMFFKVDGE